MTHKLALCKTFLYQNGTWVEKLPKWSEVYKINGKWEFWCGEEGVISTAQPKILKLVDLPQ